jgi:beta-glucosidase
MSGELGTYDIVEGNQGDRNDLALWFNGGSLVSSACVPIFPPFVSIPVIQVEHVAAVCNNTIVIVHSVGPVDMTWSNHPNITGIIYAGAPGEQTGPSIVDVIYGNFNPSGRLPFSIADVSPFHPLLSLSILTAFRCAA